MIEARGGKTPYIYHICSVFTKDHEFHIHHSDFFDTADSDDEAFGRAMTLALRVYPQANGWRNHYAQAKSLGSIDWIGRLNMSQVKPYLHDPVKNVPLSSPG
jgi:hypothetical protein